MDGPSNSRVSGAIGIFKLIAAAGATLVVSACATVPERPVEPRPDVIRSELQVTLQEDPGDAVQRISALRRSDLLPSGELEGYFVEAVDGLRAEYERARQGSSSADEIRTYRNLVAVGAEPLDSSFLSELHLNRARSLWSEGNGPAALATLMQAPDLGSLPAEDLEFAAERARELNDRSALARLAAVLSPAWREENRALIEFAAGSASPVEMSEGVATVWVNRGLRLEAGIGIPDRVIGSGFFVDPRGYLITNYHVIESEVDPEYEGFSRLYVRLPSDPAERIPARVVGYSRIFDVALLKVEIDAPYVFSLTDIRTLEPGARIFAIGSPGGLENSISSGIISAVGRRFLQMGDAVQVDVPINPGNSGGPLLDEDGRVIGLVFAGIEQFEGVNFAIPSYWLYTFFEDLYNESSVVHPWLGVSVEPASDGLEVVYVMDESPASRGGLRVGDVIQSVDGTSVDRIGGAQSLVLGRGAGSIVPVTWLRNGQELDGLFQLGARPASPVADALERDVYDRLFPVLFGMRVERVGGFSLRQSYQVTQVYRGSLADETGIAAGDTFTEQSFEYDERLDAVFLRMFIRKRTEGFVQTSIQLPAFVERDTFL